MDTGRHPGNDSVDKDLEYTYSTTISLVQMKYQTDFFVAIKKLFRSYERWLVPSDKSAFTTRQNSHVFYGEFYGKTYGYVEIAPYSGERNKTQPSIFQENCVI